MAPNPIFIGPVTITVPSPCEKSLRKQLDLLSIAHSKIPTLTDGDIISNPNDRAALQFKPRDPWRWPRVFGTFSAPWLQTGQCLKEPMTDYDFSSLNDKDFEVFCADLLGSVHNQRFERFKAGKDGGKDGRYFCPANGEVVLQCKHWPSSTITSLTSRLKKDELSKVLTLKPKRYLLAVSHKLSDADKNKILNILSPYLLSPAEIYGREDLNDLLRPLEHIERRHYKLWLSSTNLINSVLHKSVYDRKRSVAGVLD